MFGLCLSRRTGRGMYLNKVLILNAHNNPTDTSQYSPHHVNKAKSALSSQYNHLYTSQYKYTSASRYTTPSLYKYSHPSRHKIQLGTNFYTLTPLLSPKIPLDTESHTLRHGSGPLWVWWLFRSRQCNGSSQSSECLWWVILCR